MKPDWLAPLASAEWDHIVPLLLLEMKVLTTADGAALANYCQCYARMVQAEAEIDRLGIVIDVPILNRNKDVVGTNPRSEPCVPDCGRMQEGNARSARGLWPGPEFENQVDRWQNRAASERAPRARQSPARTPRTKRVRERPSQPELHPAEQYAHDVIAGKIVAGRHVRRGCQRYFDDLKTGHKRGLYFDRADAATALLYFQFFRHSKGRWGGQPVVLEPWQQFIVWCLFGWKRADGTRRFRRFYIEIARKNGKSTFIACIMLILLALDGEQGAEIYSAATKKDQAKIVFNEMQRMVRRSPELRELITVTKHGMYVAATESKAEALASDADSLDGLNIHGAAVDELHAHPTREVWDVLDTATGAREQPMLGAITTAGFNQESICYELRSYGIEVLDPELKEVTDDAFFFFIAAIDEEDDWQDERVWIKANPNLGISVNLEDLREGARKAKRNAGALNNFLTKRLNRWTQQAQRWLSTIKWKQSRAKERNDKGKLVPMSPERFLDSLKGRRCFGGLDLAEKSDLNAFALCFPPQEKGERWRYLFWFWLPEGAIEQYSESGDTKYRIWVNEGLIIETAGGSVDHDQVASDILDLLKQFDCQQIAFDPFHAGHIVNRLEANGCVMVKVMQTTKELDAGSREFEADLNDNKLEHDGSKVMGFMVDNVTAYYDRQGHMKPDKPKDRRKKTDGVIAAVLAKSRAILDTGPTGFAPFVI